MNNKSDPFEHIFRDIVDERHRQEMKWGEQNHSPIEWAAILGEQVGEVCKAALEHRFEYALSYQDIQKLKKMHGEPVDFENGHLLLYRRELIQVAAVAVSMIQSLERNELTPRGTKTE